MPRSSSADDEPLAIPTPVPAPRQSTGTGLVYVFVGVFYVSLAPSLAESCLLCQAL